MYTGGCLCGAVRYELHHEIEAITNCHCRFCRRAHGAAFITTAFVPTAALRWVSGEGEIARHEARHFCRTCATRLFNRVDALPQFTVLMVASLDDPPSLAPASHFNVESKAPWFEILDDAPQFPSLPPAIEAMIRKGDGA